MIQSAFKNDFLNERLQLWVDNLNILYVALTRAEKNMIILSNQASKKESIGELLKNTIPLIAPNLEASWDEEAGIFEYGELCTYQQMTKNKTHNLLAHLPVSCPIEMYSIHPNMEFRESNRSADFIAGIDEAESSRRFINRGSILHQLFSTIRTKADIEPSIQSLMAEGIIGGIISEEEIRQEVKQAFSLPEVQPWYDGSWQLFNECEIIWMTEDGIQQRRPDRVMLRNNEMIVVDFKFGKPKSSHERQVQTYIHLLSRMGYQNITGYLWYVDEKLIKKI
jgi:ATP-dependent exoDNAse (exonuclease V) beta subunit